MSKKKNMRDHATDLADKLAPHVETARDKAAPMLADAREKAAPFVTEAREKAAPVLADARDKVTPLAAEAKDKFTSEVLPVITAAIAAAGEATEDVRTEAKRRGLATAAALKGEVEAPKKKHRLRRFLIVLGLGGVVAAVAKVVSDRQASTAWETSYSPTPAAPAPTPVTPATTAMVDDTPTATAAAAAASQGGDNHDEAAATPDEAAADAAEAPHTATTPDNPAEEIHLDKN